MASRAYCDYLETPEWRARAAAARQRAGFRCQMCHARGCRLDVHHRTYERLGYEFPADLMVLCRTCHHRQHVAVRVQRARNRAARGLNDWATVVYGPDWFDVQDYGEVSRAFRRASTRRDDTLPLW